MSNLVTPYEQSILTGLFDNTFQTFSRSITIWKSPLKIPIPVIQEPQGTFGFGNSPVEQEYQYIPVSGIFTAVIRYWGLRHVSQADVLQGTNAFVPIGPVKIKVRQDCHDFIESGKTDKLSFDNKDFYFEGIAESHPFLGSQYWQYQIMPRT